MMRISGPTLKLILLLILAGGCGAPRRELGQVEGKLTFQGEPVGPALILFDGPSGTTKLSANVDDKGEYRVQMAEGDGLPLGEYRVAVYPPLVDFITGAAAPVTPRPADIPASYADPRTSGLKLRVNSGANRFDIDMQPNGQARPR